MLRLKLDELYKDKGLTQKEVSKATQIRESTLSGMRRNSKESWDVHLLERLLVYFEIEDVTDFIEYNPPEDVESYLDEYNRQKEEYKRIFGKN
ncbi:helix-turn-helix domain-containing protein [Lentibacillus cibarius]|uniref:helix-turn-helix domain-containing protein n=1 Tax=Lentibacillus cibarius TaxID=2583219 RepID=UPI00163DBA7D|nr:helix-turn-helix transcriptional regulator [Lentibacillus cibarius]